MLRRFFLAFMLVLSVGAFSPVATTAMAAAPSYEYCRDTLHGTAGWSYLSDDDEIVWMRKFIERNWSTQLGSKGLHWNYTQGNTRYIAYLFYDVYGRYVTIGSFACTNYYWDSGGFLNFKDYPVGRDPWGWYS